MRSISRLQADVLLFVTACIWGFAFVAQKAGMASTDPLAFVGARFALSAAVVFPFAIAEFRSSAPLEPIGVRGWVLIAALMICFVAGAIVQQIALLTATVTAAGFLTVTYVIIVPMISILLFRHAPSQFAWPAGALSMVGIFLLNGASLRNFSTGDWLLILSAGFFAFQIIFLDLAVRRTDRPFTLCFLQSAASAAVGLAVSASNGQLDWAVLLSNPGPLLYSGIVAGGIGFAMQAIAQRHTPPADAALIMATEALFAALAGALLLNESLNAASYFGGGLIICAILLIEIGPMLFRAKTNS